MYKRFLRPFLFLFDPESIHHFIVLSLRVILFLPFFRSLVRWFYNIDDHRLKKELFGLTFSNPVGLAAGFDKNASFVKEMASFGFSFIEIGTVTPEPQPGNTKPRLFRLPADKALINRMGINNAGVEQVVKNLRRFKTHVVIGGNIGKNTLTSDEHAMDDYVKVFMTLYSHVDYIAVNVSCPNVGDISRLQDKVFLNSLFTKLKKIDGQLGGEKPIFVKVAPEFSFEQIDDFIDLVHETGITGIIATNTTKERSSLVSDPDLVDQIGMGGLSGKPLKDRSTEVIRYICEKTGNHMPVIGAGGIMSPGDALEKLEAGACLLQLYTGFVYEGPGIAKRINKAILRQAEEVK
jgi:dihydroorotate dehydrogenase